MTPNARRERDLVVPAILGLVVWSTLAIGGVYPWAYWPALAGAVVLGAITMGSPRAWAPGEAPRRIAPAALALLGVIALQLIPVPASVISRVSPARHQFLAEFDTAYAWGATAWHTVSIDPSGTWRGWCFLAALAILLIGLVRAMDESRVQRLAGAMTVFALVVALAGIISRGFQSSKVYGLWTPEFPAIPFGPFVNRNHFAGWMVMALSLALGYFSARASRAMRGLKPGWRNHVLWWSSPQANYLILVAASCAVMGLSLVLTSSRSGIGGFALSVLLMGWAVTKRRMGTTRKVAVGAYLMVLFVTVIGWAGLDAVAQRFTAANWSTLNDRLGAWGDALRVFRAFPFAGAGWNTYGSAMLLYQRSQVNQFHFAEAHNDYLQVLAAGGLLVGVPLAIAAWTLGRQIWRRVAAGTDDTSTFWLRAGAITGLIGVLCQEVVDFSLQIPANAILFTVVLAVAIHRPAQPGRPGRLRVVAGPPASADVHRATPSNGEKS